jgi:hypothetical protein
VDRHDPGVQLRNIAARTSPALIKFSEKMIQGRTPTLSGRNSAAQKPYLCTDLCTRRMGRIETEETPKLGVYPRRLSAEVTPATGGPARP